MKSFFLLLVLSLVINRAPANTPDHNLFQQLNLVLKNKQSYISLKTDRIKRLQGQLDNTTEPGRRFTIYRALYNEYKSFRYDSAYSYSKKLQVTADLLHDPVKVAVSKMSMSFTLLSSGMFKETLEELGQISTGLLDTADKIEYYFLKGRCYFDLGDFNHNIDYSHIYYPRAIACIDSALAISSKNTYSYLALSGLKNMRIRNYRESEKNYIALLKLQDLSASQYAVTASSLSYVYSVLGKKDMAINLLIKAAMADIRSATEETVAMYELASTLYKSGNENDAFTFINEAMEEAIFYGARHRQVAISRILPIIQAQRIKSIEDQRRSLFIYASIITVLILFVIVFSIIINRQLKKIRAADKIIQEANNSLQESNAALAKVNHSLSTANKIKNEYITYYFNINSIYIEKLEAIQKSLEKKLKNKRYEDAVHTLKNMNLQNERQELFHTFDKIFLSLFPDFPVRFNALFNKEDEIAIPEGKLLGTEHRIFALIRMGIHDNDRIAKLLGYSVNTIYAYKNRIKNKSVISNVEFEGQIMKIETV
jgi:tetratricopeptide (TPR) repeat protein